MTLVGLFRSDTGTIVFKRIWVKSSQVRPPRLFPSQNRTIVPKWGCHNCSQMTLVQLFPNEAGTVCSQEKLVKLFPSETGTTFFKWDWKDCFRFTLTTLFQSDTDTIILKRHWDNCFQVRLARLFPSDTDKTVLKWD